MIWIGHGIYDYEFDIVLYRQKNTYVIPAKFVQLLKDRAKRWEENGWSGKWKYTLIPFTFALNTKWNIWAIAIKHPRDVYRRDIGENIVAGRIARQCGEMVPQRWEYNRLVMTEEPAFMICQSIKLGDPTIKQRELNGEYRSEEET
jgi:hypothetical protein